MYKITKVCGVLATFMITGCSDFQMDPDVYTGEESMNDMRTYACTILSRRTVQVAGYNTNDNVAGGLLGALAGGALGSAFGGGSGKAAMVGAGALGGAVAGSAIQKSTQYRTKTKAYEYTVKLDVKGSLRTIVQGCKVVFNKGDRAYLVVDKKRTGNAHLIPME